VNRLAAVLADRYRVEREVGAGGMATVYSAEDLKRHRKVAITLLRPELSVILGVERFLKEIETTADLQHPHILTVVDSGPGRRNGLLREALGQTAAPALSPGWLAALLEVMIGTHEPLDDLGRGFEQRLRLRIIDLADILAGMGNDFLEHALDLSGVMTRIAIVTLVRLHGFVPIVDSAVVIRRSLRISAPEQAWMSCRTIAGTGLIYAVPL
jgi:serine/threonine protein kinase